MCKKSTHILIRVVLLCLSVFIKSLKMQNYNKNTYLQKYSRKIKNDKNALAPKTVILEPNFEILSLPMPII